MKKGILAIVIVVLLGTIVFSGCLENKQESSANNKLTANQILEKLVNATDNINSYKYNSTATFTKTVFNKSERNITEFHMFINASINISNRSLKYEEEYVNIETSEKIYRISYFLDNYEYKGTWNNSNLSWETIPSYESSIVFFWETYSYLELLNEKWLEMIENKNITFTRLDDVSLDGKQYYVLNAVITTNYSNLSHSGYRLSEWQYKYWIDKSTNLLYKESKKQIIDVTDYYFETSSYFDSNDGDRGLITNEFVTTFYDYNIPVTIELPPEALQET